MKFAMKLNNNDYFPIHKSYIDLAIENDDFNTLKGIDEFTSIYTKEELFESFVRSNVLKEETFDILRNNIYKDNPNVGFVIIYNENGRIRELKAISKEDGIYEFDVLEYLLNIIDNKNLINQICNFILTKNYISEDLKTFVILLSNHEDDIIRVYYSNLDYIDQRILKVYVFNKILNKEKTLKLSLYN